MKKYFLLFLLVSLCFMQRGERWKNRLYNNPNAGNKDKQELNQLSDEAKMLFYQTEKLSPEAAFLYQFSLPLPFVNLGYAYSDNWGRGLKWDLAILGCFLIGEDMDWGEKVYNEPAGQIIGYDGDGDNDKADGLKLLIVGMTVYKMIDVFIVYVVVVDFNSLIYLN